MSETPFVARQRVKVCSLGSSHFQLVIDKHGHILLHRFLLNGILHIAILVEGVFKFALCYRLAVDNHQYGVCSRLRPSGQGQGEEGRK